MRGDPREFPHEIRTLTGKSCNLILFPWRASQYVERLFWGSLRTVAAPVALIVMLDTTLTPTIADIAMSEGVVGEATRNRSQSAAIARSRALSSTSDSENNAAVSVMADDRDRVPYAPGSPVSGMSPTSSPDTSTRVSRKRLSAPDDSVSIPIMPPPPPTDGILLNRQSVSIKNMLCVVTGSSMCSAIFPIALRFAERGSIAVTLLVTSDRRQFNESLVEALTAFRKATEDVKNITVVTLTTPSTDVESILIHCAELMYDLIVFGFRDESSSGEDVIPPPARFLRSASIWDNAPALDGAGECRHVYTVCNNFIYPNMHSWITRKLQQYLIFLSSLFSLFSSPPCPVFFRNASSVGGAGESHHLAPRTPRARLARQPPPRERADLFHDDIARAHCVQQTATQHDVGGHHPAHQSTCKGCPHSI